MSAAKTANDFDVLVIGGGLAGLTLVNLLAASKASGGRHLRLGVVDSHPPAASGTTPSLGLRVSALAPSSVHVLRDLGLWQQLNPATVGVCERMSVWQGASGWRGGHAIHFDSAALAVPALNYVVDNQQLRSLLWQQAEDRGVVLLDREPAGTLQLQSDALNLDTTTQSLSASLVVGADGGHSWVRQQLGVGFSERHYGQSAVIAHMATELPHRNVAWQRFLPGGPVALLPLADGRSSLVWSCDTSVAEDLLAMAEGDFAGRLAAMLDRVLGDMECTTERLTFPLLAGLAEQVAGHRFALIGDAAHRIHPLAGQGINLGILDAAVLAAELTRHLRGAAADPGDPLALRRYARRRAAHTRLMLEVTDSLQRIFRHQGSLAGAGMGVVQQLPWLRDRLARYALGLGQLPASGA